MSWFILLRVLGIDFETSKAWTRCTNSEGICVVDSRHLWRCWLGYKLECLHKLCCSKWSRFPGGMVFKFFMFRYGICRADIVERAEGLECVFCTSRICRPVLWSTSQTFYTMPMLVICSSTSIWRINCEWRIITIVLLGQQTAFRILINAFRVSCHQSPWPFT
jgi:hypothetical protein